MRFLYILKINGLKNLFSGRVIEDDAEADGDPK
jgi:hypothetical protein